MLNDLLAKNQSSDKLYVEDVFSTWLYTGTGASQTITNGIDLAGKGGLVWIKSRSAAANNVLVDTVRGAYASLSSNLTVQSRGANTVTNFNSTGFTVTNDTSDATFMNTTGVSGTTYASWTFREAPKFFDVVTWSGNSTNRTISHSLGSVPGMIIVKRTDTTADWQVYHRSFANTEYAVLNTTAAKATGATRWNSTTATDTVFSLGTDSTVNATGGSYVAYLFAHDTTADGVIQCGSWTHNGTSGNSINLGWEPQYLLYKRTNAAASWAVHDNMRGLGTTGGYWLAPNTSSAESGPVSSDLSINATGFSVAGGFSTNNDTYIYLAIRRGPMRVPTDATKVYTPIATSAATGTTLTTGFPVDTQIFSLRSGTTNKGNTYDRLRGVSSTTTESGVRLITNATSAENTAGNETRLWDNTGFQMPSSFGGSSTVFWNFRRAPGFFDVVCYTGTGSATTQAHNLGVVPELMIVKSRSITPSSWQVYAAPVGNTKYLTLDTTDASITASSRWNNTTPTNAVFTLGINGFVNQSGGTYVAYLFASCPGVSKVGTYTGTGTTNQINCGFTNGARFVLIKRTDSTGDWYVWDTARGIVAGNDPYLLLNSTAAEVTNTDYVDAYSAGFELSSTAPAALNANGGTYIYLAIA